MLVRPVSNAGCRTLRRFGLGATRPSDQRGTRVLGTPLGSREFVAASPAALSADHAAFLAGPPGGLVVAPLLRFCPCPPEQTRAFAAEHDRSFLHCLENLLQFEQPDLLPNSAASAAQRFSPRWTRSPQRCATLPFRVLGANGSTFTLGSARRRGLALPECPPEPVLDEDPSGDTCRLTRCLSTTASHFSPLSGPFASRFPSFPGDPALPRAPSPAPAAPLAFWVCLVFVRESSG